MKNLKNLFAILLITGLSTSAFAQGGATLTNQTVGAVLIKALTLTKEANAEMHFGTALINQSSDGTIVLDPSGNSRSFTGGVQQSPVTPIFKMPLFTVTGTAGEGYAITIPNSRVLTHTDLSSTVTVDTWTTNKTSNASILTDGTDTFRVGATLNVLATTKDGVYTGTYDVTVNYN
jgi:hypothetical protein